MDRTWRSRRSSGNETSLAPGIPEWLASPLNAWLKSVEERFYYNVQIPRAALAEEFDILTQEPNPFVKIVNSYSLPTALEKRNDVEFSLDFLDYLVAKLQEYEQDDLIASLDQLLTSAGSEWRVGVRGEYGALEKRVPEGVHLAANHVMTQGSTAGALLSEAWHAAFGRNPDAEEAYEKAIKAVEEAATSVVLPANSKATLGTVASTMRDQGDWKLPLGEDPKNLSSDVVAKMVRALWSGQESRHGGNGYRKPTQEEAESAVLLAVPLVQWFTAGTVRRQS